MLAAAERRAIEVGLTKLRVGQVAADAGVSRQTVYNEFGDKFGIALAVALRTANRLLDDVEVELARHEALPDAVAATMAYVLRASTELPVIALAVRREWDDGMIALITTHAGPVIDVARGRLAEAGMRRWPDAHRDDVELAADLATRLTISHIVCPTEPIEESARKLATAVAALINARRAGT